ncbi:MAG TPA: hypothetical protein VFW75_15605 [Acetobacteraceae bacterium]|nr:hypothetical protein [Acetobacteraceae bacterium]
MAGHRPGLSAQHRLHGVGKLPEGIVGAKWWHGGAPVVELMPK